MTSWPEVRFCKQPAPLNN